MKIYRNLFTFLFIVISLLLFVSLFTIFSFSLITEPSNSRSTVTDLSSISTKSNFLETEYECFGSCVCENSEIRRTPSSVKSVTLFSSVFFALSISTAYRLSSVHFGGQCEILLQNEDCDRDHIKSEVDYCELIRNEEDGSYGSTTYGNSEDEKTLLSASRNLFIRKKSNNKASSSNRQSSSKRIQKREPPEKMKMVVVIRKDLRLRMGKVGSQCVHAALSGVSKIQEGSKKKFKSNLDSWKMTGEKTVVVGVNSEEEFQGVYTEAHNKGLPVSKIIVDAGRTQLREPTSTCFSIGPALWSKIDEVTGGLKLL